MLGWYLKVSIVLWRHVAKKIILGFRSKVLVILVKGSWKTSDSLVSSETMHSFAEIKPCNSSWKVFTVREMSWVYLWEKIFFSLSWQFCAKVPLSFVDCPVGHIWFY